MPTLTRDTKLVKPRSKKKAPFSRAIVLHPQQHQHHRRLGFVEKQAFHAKPSVRFLDHVVTITGIVAPLSNLPQLFDIIHAQSGAGISMITWGTAVVTKAVWTLYGLTHREWPIIISNALLLIVNAMIVGAVLYYR